MRLINCETINCKALTLEEFIGGNIPEYAILSHTWGEDEITFADLAGLKLDLEPVKTRASFRKTTLTCRQALEHSLKYAWVDTLCIDKSSSSELSEAINSMFSWYRNAARCYVYLSDVSGLQEDKTELSTQEKGHVITQSRWFTHGWTLQELIAPTTLAFYDREWYWLGMRRDHAEQIAKATSIDTDFLRHGMNRHSSITSRSRKHVSLTSFCVAQRMSWASGRETTRGEDTAYLYGEGRKKAFYRLQEEIIKSSADDSILAWGLCPSIVADTSVDWVKDVSPIRHRSTLLASSPDDFKDCGNISIGSQESSSFSMSNNGLRICLPVIHHENPKPVVGALQSISVGILNCQIDTTWPSYLDVEQGSVPGPSLLGILLDANTSAKSTYSRCQSHVDKLRGQTISIDPRLAFRAQVEDIVIRREARDLGLGPKASKQHRCFVSVSPSLSDITCINAEIWDIGSLMNGKPIESGSHWDREKSTLSVYLSGIHFGYAVFTFSTDYADNTFVVVFHISSSLPVVRKGSFRAPMQIARFLRDLGRIPELKGERNIISIKTANGGTQSIEIDVNTKQIYEWNISEIKVSEATSPSIIEVVKSSLW